MSPTNRPSRHERLAKPRLVRAPAGPQRHALRQRRVEVGTLAHECGLLALDDALLRGMFTFLALVAQEPDPVALVTDLLTTLQGL
jgi:hypothetical protein